MNDLFGREKFGHLPRAISEGGKRTRTYEVGDVIYWSPGPDVAMFYRHDGQSIPSPGIIVLAKIESGMDVLNAFLMPLRKKFSGEQLAQAEHRVAHEALALVATTKSAAYAVQVRLELRSRLASILEVNEAAAGTTKLTSAQERANSSVKNATAIKPTATHISTLRAMVRITDQTPALRQSSSGLPICFMARDMRQSPAVEAKTSKAIDSQVYRGERISRCSPPERC